MVCTFLMPSWSGNKPFKKNLKTKSIPLQVWLNQKNYLIQLTSHRNRQLPAAALRRSLHHEWKIIACNVIVIDALGTDCLWHCDMRGSEHALVPIHIKSAN